MLNLMEDEKMIVLVHGFCSEITPYYLVHSDFVSAKNRFLDGVSNNFEDLLILQSARRLNGVKFITNDKELLKLNIDMKISKP
jgi:hypothetical protein